MQRLIRLSLFVVLIGMFSASLGFSQSNVTVSGSIAAGDVRIFVKDSIYEIQRDYVVAGTLIIEPGTMIHFFPNSRLIDSTGGRIIADGFAKATYNANPNGINPVTQYEPLGYASFDYFFYNAVDQYNDASGSARTIKIETPNEPTVHKDKYNHIFNVLLDKANRKIIDLVDPSSSTYPKWRNKTVTGNSNLVVVSFEQALMFITARLNNDPENFDPNLKVLPWKRLGNSSVNKVDIVPQPISFVGQPVKNFSREWGHIIILPGARAAFFRNVVFQDIKKDTTVDREKLYNVPTTNALWTAINNRMKDLVNGAGGAITTFSSRTWLLDVTFKNNMARLRGGALNILQAPKEFAFLLGDTTGIGCYNPLENPQLTNKDGSPSIINRYIPKIDLLDEDETMAEPFGSANFTRRQGLDDGRISVFLGRMRRMTFDNNAVQLASFKEDFVDGVKRVYDDVNNPADYPMSFGNHAYGGAIYIAGVDEYKDRQIEVSFGLNHSIMVGGNQVFFAQQDEFHATKNEARDYQSSMNTDGARGGAIYAGKYTSLIVAGEFSNNRAYSKYFDDAQYWGAPSGIYSLGGAIFAENTLARLQVRGEPARENTNPTYFTANTAGAGGAIYVDGNTSPMESPVIGGSDATLNTRDYGFDIKFENNIALTFGGAILAKRNMSINGSGGVEASAIIGYDGKYPVRFWNNKAGFSGGALDVRVPNAIPPLPSFQRSVKMIRAEFVNNTVGADVDGNNLKEIRGGGAVYAYNGELNVVKAVDFIGNTVYHGNGGAVSMVNLQDVNSKRYFLSDLDQITSDANGQPLSYASVNDPFTGVSQVYPADTRMLTRFLDNKILNPNDEFFKSQLGSGTTQVGQGTPLTSLSILATKWTSDNTGFAVGMDGLMIRLTNGGTKWQYMNSGTPYRITDIEFVTAQIGYIVGDRGVIRKTIDGGTTWFALNSGISTQINDVVFIGSNLGYAVANGGYILKTIDGGTTWTSQKASILDLNSIYFTNSNNGYAVGDNAEVLYTTDGGTTWQVKDIIGTREDLNSVYFLNTTKGFIFGKNGVGLFTNNSGNTWEIFPTGTTSTFNKVYFTTQQVGYAVGNGGLAYKTVDGGTTWTNMTTGSSYSFYSTDFPSINIGYIVGDAGLILKTKDAGTTWSVVEPSDKKLC